MQRGSARRLGRFRETARCTIIEVASGAHAEISCLFFVTERTTGLRFLFDTGAEVNVIPSSAVIRKRRQV